MDFSKYKKILYILMIFSILLSIKSRVFAADYTVDESYMYDIYQSRTCSFILRFNTVASDELKRQVADLYTSGVYFPFLAVRNENSNDNDSAWDGISDFPNLCGTYNGYLLYFIPFANTTRTYVGTGYMSFSSSNVFTYKSTNAGYFVSVTSNGGAGLYDYSRSEITISANLYGYHSIYLDDYFNGIKYGNSQDVLTALNNANNKLEQIKDSLTNTTPSTDSQNIANDLQNTDNSTGADNVNTNFFSTITSIFSDIGNYTLSDYNTVNIPIPFTDGTITIESNYLYTVIPRPLQALISSFWYFVFGFYAFKFINKIYISVKTGNILNGFSNSDEVITNNML